MDKQLNYYGLLKNKAIYAVLDGDTHFELANGDDAAMPYQSGPMLVDTLNHFGLPASYDSKSRWMYVEELLEHCIENNRVSDMLAYFFSLERFNNDLRGLDAASITTRHAQIVQAALEQINGELYFSSYELKLSGGSYVVAKVGSAPAIVAPSIKSIDQEYIKGMADRAQTDIVNGDYDSALTKARTLLEEVFCYVIERKSETPSDSGDIGKLYKQVKDLYNMHADPNMDRRFNTLLSGLEKVVSAVAEMRNKNSDAHGVGSKRLAIRDYHARLMVNASTNMADFILAVAAHANADSGKNG